MAMTKEENDKFWSQFHSNIEAPVAATIYYPMCQTCTLFHDWDPYLDIGKPRICKIYEEGIPRHIYRSHTTRPPCEHYNPDPKHHKIREMKKKASK